MRKFLFCLISIFFFGTFNSAYAYYHPTPEMVPAVTTAAINAHWYYDKTMYYPLGNPLCYSAAEAAARNALPDTSTWFSTDPPTSCKKCPAGGGVLTGVNGSEVCLQDCPSPYVYGTYFETSGCFNCPDKYIFRNGDCQWNSVGSPPARPVPLAPKNLTASDGTSDINVIVKWAESDYTTDHYILERSSDGKNWDQFKRINDGVDKTRKYYDKSAVPPVAYVYRVKACNSDDQCSGYSNSDLGYKNLQVPKPLLSQKSKYNETLYQIKFTWQKVTGAKYYQIYFAKEQGFVLNFSKEKFQLKANVSENRDSFLYWEASFNDPIFKKLSEHATAVRACGHHNNTTVCGPVALHNNSSPPGVSALINLLLNK